MFPFRLVQNAQTQNPPPLSSSFSSALFFLFFGGGVGSSELIGDREKLGSCSCCDDSV